MDFSAISKYVSNGLGYLPTFTLATPQQVVKNVTRLALPAILLVAVAMAREARAITYVECINNCDEHRDAHELAKLLCYTLCLIFAKG